MKEKIAKGFAEQKALWIKEKDVFFVSFLVGLLAHGYMLTNKLPNIDEYVHMFHHGHGYELGRWLYGLMGNFTFRIDGVYSLPFFNGVLHLILLSISIAIFLKPFDFRSRWTKCVFAALFVAFPTVACNMGFMFTLPYYGIAVLFMAIAFYVLVNYRYGFIASTLLICCSLGIYQAYWGLAAGFLLLYLITECMNEKTEAKPLILLAVKSLIALLFGVILYLIVNKIMVNVQDVEMTVYQGVDKIGQLEISQIPSILQKAYGYFFRFTTENYLHITWYPLVRAVIALGYILTVIFGVVACVINRKHILKTVAMVLFTVLFPLAVNSIYIMSNERSNVHTLMCYSVVLVFLLPLVYVREVVKRCSRKVPAQVAKYAYLAAVLAVTVIYVRFSNIYYMNLETSYKQTHSFMVTLSTRMQELEGYDSELPVYFHGWYSKSSNRNIWELRMVNDMHGSIDIVEAINSPLMRHNLFRVYLGNPINEISDLTVIEKNWQQIQDMPDYPNDGSLAIIDDIIVIKLSDK
ncbi:MAG: hypothetical protein E7293_10545 [Lachnospiraceae bacterium]|nr:hypothetical protein [Lachnospiraceae bacterium]